MLSFFIHVFPIKGLSLIFCCWLSQNAFLFLCKRATHLQTEVSGISKLLRTTVSKIMCGILRHRSFRGEFLALLKGAAKFLSDFTGEEPVFYL